LEGAKAVKSVIANDPFPPSQWSNHLLFPWFAKLEDRYSSYIGTDLFSGTKLASGEWAATKDPAQLVTKHGLNANKPIGFFIVAGHQRIIGVTPTNATGGQQGTPLLGFDGLDPANETFVLPPIPQPVVNSLLASDEDDDAVVNNTLSVFDEHDFGPPTLVEESKPKLLGKFPDATKYPLTDPISKNAVSIVTMVIGWKNEADPNNHEILHFAGGDVSHTFGSIPPVFPFLSVLPPAAAFDCYAANSPRSTGMSKAVSQRGSPAAGGPRTPAGSAARACGSLTSRSFITYPSLRRR